MNEYVASLGSTLGEALLTPTKIYVKALNSVKEAGITIKGCSHITGGGFYENVPRMLPDGVRAVIKKDSFEVLPIFTLIQESGNISEEMMYGTYNMGIGMMLVVEQGAAAGAVEALRKAGEKAYKIGTIKVGEKGVTIC